MWITNDVNDDDSDDDFSDEHNDDGDGVTINDESKIIKYMNIWKRAQAETEDVFFDEMDELYKKSPTITSFGKLLVEETNNRNLS